MQRATARGYTSESYSKRLPMATACGGAPPGVTPFRKGAS